MDGEGVSSAASPLSEDFSAPLVRIGPRKGRELRSERVILRLTPSAREEFRRIAADEGRTESDVVRVLIGEALAQRARTKRR